LFVTPSESGPPPGGEPLAADLQICHATKRLPSRRWVGVPFDGGIILGPHLPPIALDYRPEAGRH
jgi:hypothetical protein